MSIKKEVLSVFTVAIMIGTIFNGVTSDSGKNILNLFLKTRKYENISLNEPNLADNLADDQLDQYQNETGGGGILCGWWKWAQSFKPSLDILTRVVLLIRKQGIIGDITVSIRRFLNGPDLVSVSKTSSQIPTTPVWIEFDFADLNVIPGETYYIVASTTGGDNQNNYYLLYGSGEDVYENGDAWIGWNQGTNWEIWTPEFDFCFRTYGRIGENISDPPAQPTQPSGPSTGFTGICYTYSTSTTDPNGDDVYYLFDWGDGSYSSWLGPYESGETINASHNWLTDGIYYIKVKAKDIYGMESEWSSPKTVTISKSWNQEWNKTYSNAFATCVKVYNDYVYVAGSVNSIPYEENDIIILKYDFNGNLIWERTWNRYPYDVAWDIGVYDDYIYVVGYGSDWHSAITYSNISILKYDNNGNIIWAKNYNNSRYDFAYSVAVYNNSLYVGGQSNCEALVLKYSLNGNLQWEKHWNVSNEMYSEVTHIDVENNYIYAVGQTQDKNGDENIFLIKYDNDGNIIWSNIWDVTGSQQACGIDASNDSIYISGFGDIPGIDATGLILKYSENGTLIWNTSFGHFKLEGIKEDSGTLYVAGEECGTTPYPSDWNIFVARADGDAGDILDYEIIYSDECGMGRDIDVYGDNFYVVGSEGDNALIIKYGFSSSGNYRSSFGKENKEEDKNRSLNIKINLGKNVYGDVAAGAAKWLMSLAEPAGDGYKWPVSETEQEYSTHLLDGTAGISLFFLKMYEATENETYLDYAEGGMKWLMSMAVSENGGYKWPKNETSNLYFTGFYEGAAGIGKVFLNFYKSLGNTTYLNYAEGAARWIESVNGIETGYEMIMGAAGIGIFFLELFNVTGNIEYLNYAKTGGDWLISTARNCPVLFLTDMGNPFHMSKPIKNGCLWITSDIPYYWITSTGFGHGIAGPVYFLSELYKVCGDEKYLDCAEKAAQWIIHEAVIEGNGNMQWRWKYRLDQEESPFYYNTGWCYGNAGIGTAFISLYEITNNSYYLTILEKTAGWLFEQAITAEEGYRWIIRDARAETQAGASFAQMCHGVAGIGDYMLDMFNLTGIPIYRDYGLEAAEWIKNVAVEDSGGYKWDTGYTGYFFGTAGIGLFLLEANKMNVWSKESIDSGGGAVSIDVNISNCPYISYYNEDGLKIAWLNGSSWHTEIIDSCDGLCSSLALDSTGKPHIAYVDSDTGILKYAIRNSGTWTIQAIDSSEGIVFASIAIDTNNNPHIAYIDYHEGTAPDNGALKYATKTYSGWNIETVVSGGNVGFFVSLSLDSSNQPYIFYDDWRNDMLKMATKYGSSWTLSDIASTGIPLDSIIDSVDVPHICFVNYSNNELVYGYKNGGSWTIETIEKLNDPGFASIAVDSYNNPCISYVDYGEGVLKYAAKTQSWSIEAVDAGNIGFSASLSLDSNNVPHIAYFDRKNVELKYAYIKQDSIKQDSFPQSQAIRKESEDIIQEETKELVLFKWQGGYAAGGSPEPFNLYCHAPVLLEDEQAPLIIEDVWCESPGEIYNFKIAHGYSGNNTLLNISMKATDMVNVSWYAWAIVRSKDYNDLPSYIELIPEEELPSHVKKWLSSTDFLPVDEGRIRMVAKTLRGYTNNVNKIARKVTRFTGNTLPYQGGSDQDALSTLKNHYAVCTGKADLAGALMRANGIPARVLFVLSTHYIIEYYAPQYGWVRCETTSGIMPYPNQYYTVSFCAYPEDETDSNIVNGQHPYRGVIAYWGTSPPVNWDIVYDNWDTWMYTLSASSQLIDEAMNLTKEAWSYYHVYLGTSLTPQQQIFFDNAVSYEENAITCFINGNINGYIENMSLACNEFKNIPNNPPIANFDYIPSNPTTQNIVLFIDKSSDSDGYIVNYTWDFGDGAISYEKNPTHKYADNGVYNVTLTVTDDDGATNSTYKLINVDNAQPTAQFKYSPADLYTIQFTDLSNDSDGIIVNWTWDFGDGNISYEQNPKHKYADAGTYNVTLTITDNDGATDSISKNVSVWTSRKPINLWVSSGKTPAYYQVLLNISYDANMNPDFSDLRFIRYADNVTELDYWIERKVDAQWANVWVELADNITTENKTLAWLYYGNPNATSASNGSATFLFFDDFNDGVWDDKWNIDKNTDGIGLVYQLNGKLFLRTKEVSRTISIITKNSFESLFDEYNGTILEYDAWTKYNPPYPKSKDGKLRSYIIAAGKWIASSYSGWSGNVKLYDSNGNSSLLGRTSRRTCNIHAFVSLGCNISNSWMRWKEINDPAWIEDDFNSSITTNMTTTSIKIKLELYCGGEKEGQWSQIAFDNLKLRKYHNPEPEYYIG